MEAFEAMTPYPRNGLRPSRRMEAMECADILPLKKIKLQEKLSLVKIAISNLTDYVEKLEEELQS